MRLIEQGLQTIDELTESSELARPTVSHHLKLLEQVSLVSITRLRFDVSALPARTGRLACFVSY